MNKNRANDRWEYKCIDGNWTWHPEAYCKRKHGVLTEGLMKTHHCKERECPMLDETVVFDGED